MIRSMTGYGSAQIERDGHRLSAEIRSVNHRFCEVSVRAPKLVGMFEDQIRQLIQDKFSRGKFNLSVSWAGAGDEGDVLKLNDAVTDRYVALLQQLKQKYGL
ncbi:MAG TPA: YicC/YloC family endoribonuclease, partial [Dongiaceae bacterium]|nr:YicC/YloC family endoribonuclease [Dongiaceae bacterium]